MNCDQGRELPMRGVGHMFLRCAVSVICLTAFFFSPQLLAEVVVDPTAEVGFRPNVGKVNGVPVVEIVKPTEGGVSHNKYERFDVGAEGVVLNNATEGGVSQLAGTLGANVRLGGQAARVILNEVTKDNPTRIEGTIEVFGRKAEVIVANPFGVRVNGGRAINVSRLTLTTATPQVSGVKGEKVTLLVRNGKVRIEGAGLDGTAIKEVELIGRVVEIDGKVSAAETLRILAGQRDEDHETRTSSGTGASGSAGVVHAIDGTALGAMEAGRITVISSDQGVGVRQLGGMAASAGDLVLDSKGNLTVASGQAQKSAKLKSAGQTRVKGIVLAEENVEIEGAEVFVESGARVMAAQDAQVQAEGTLQHLGKTEAGRDVTLKAQGALTQSGRVESGRNITLEATTLINSGWVKAPEMLKLACSGAVANQGGQWIGQRVEVTATTLANHGFVQARDLGLALTVSAIDNSGGKLYSDKDLDLLIAGSVVNADGLISVIGTLTAQLGGSFANTAGGSVQADQIVVSAASIDNRNGEFVSDGNLHLEARSGAFDNAAGLLAGGGEVTLSGSGNFNNTGGTVLAVGDLDAVMGGGWMNAGGLLQSDGDMDVRLGGAMTQSGRVSSSGDGFLRSSSFHNTGQTLSAGALAVIVSGNLVHDAGLIAANDGILLQAGGSVLNRSVVESGLDLVVIAAYLDNEYRLYADRDALLTAGTFANDNLVAANNRLSWSGASLYNRANLLSGGTMTLAASGAIVNDFGWIQSYGNMGISAASFENRASGTKKLVVAPGGMGPDGIAYGANYQGMGNDVTHVLHNWSGDISQIGRRYTSLNNVEWVGNAASVYNEYLALGMNPAINPISLMQAMTLRQGYAAIEVSTGVQGSHVSADGHLTMQVGTVLNPAASSITSGGDMAIMASGWVRQNTLTVRGYWFEGDALLPDVRSRAGGSTIPDVYFPDTPLRDTGPLAVVAAGTIKSGGNALIQTPLFDNQGILEAYNLVLAAGTVRNGIFDPTIYSPAPTLPQARISTGSYFSLPKANDALFSVSRDPAARYLVNASVPLGGGLSVEYLLNALGLGSAGKFLADPLAEARLLRQAALAQTGRAFFSHEWASDTQQRKALYDNAIEFVRANPGLSLGQTLSPELIARLTKPMLWYETQVVEGESVLVPVVYLSSADQIRQAKVVGGLIEADNALFDVSGLFHNTGYVTVRDSLVINAGEFINERRTVRQRNMVTEYGAASLFGGRESREVEVWTDVVQPGGEITAGTIQITSFGDLWNKGGLIAGTDAVSLVAGGAIRNEAVRGTYVVTYNPGGNFWSSLFGVSGGKGWDLGVYFVPGSIQSGGTLDLAAGRSIHNIGSDIAAVGDVRLFAPELIEQDIREATFVSQDSVSSSGLFGFTHQRKQEIVTQRSQIFSAEGDVFVQAGNATTIGSIQSRGSTIAAARDIFLTATGDITFDAATVQAEEMSGFGGFTGLTLHNESTRYDQTRVELPEVLAGRDIYVTVGSPGTELEFAL